MEVRKMLDEKRSPMKIIAKIENMQGANLSFSLFFVVPDYASGGDVEYSYMLEGYDKDWGAFSSVNEASYFSVPSVDYLFKVVVLMDITQLQVT